MMESLIKQIPVSRPPILAESWENIVLPIDKPKGISSGDVLRRLKRILGRLKMGHAGTLDPMATGLLICLVGQATKLMRHFLEMPKVYTGRIRLGETTASFDAETQVISRVDSAHVTDDMIRHAVRSFEGTIRQKTPMYSAVRLGGERLYKKARRGEIVETPFRDVTIYSITSEPKADNEFDFSVECSKGTYVRSIAHDLGNKLEVGAHLVSLRRDRIGAYNASEAWSLESLESAVGAADPIIN